MPSTGAVAEHLRRYYGINGGIVRVPTGRADNYRVEGAARSIFGVVYSRWNTLNNQREPTRVRR